VVDRTQGVAGVFKEGPGILGWRAQEGTGEKSGIWLRARAGLAGWSSGSAGKTELTAWVPRVNGRGATRSCWRVGLRFGVDAAERSAEGKRGAGPRATRGVARVL